MRSQNRATPTPKVMPGTATGSTARYARICRLGILVRCVVQEITMPIVVDTVAAINEMSRLFCSVTRTSSELHKYWKFTHVKRPDQVKVENAAAISTSIGAIMVKKQ